MTACVPFLEEIPRSLYLLIALGSFLVPFAFWCFETYTGRANALVFPTPAKMVAAAVETYRDGLSALGCLRDPLGILMEML